jgi:hypothetical protein
MLSDFNLTDLYISKRRRSAKDEDAIEYTCKSPRIQENRQYLYIHIPILVVYCRYYLSSAVNKRRHNPVNEVQSQPSRKNPRLQEIRDLN